MPADIACLPMYDLPELQEANDALWQAIAARLLASGVDAPAHLSRPADPRLTWTDPALLLGQTCGYPLVTSLQGKVALLATPSYGAAGCEGPCYRSAIVVRAADRATGLADLRHGICAVNDSSSHSGMNALRAAIAPLAGGAQHFFGEVVVTGAHAASVEAVVERRADVAAIDCVTWAHLQRLRPGVTRLLRVLEWTLPAPGLPLITAPGTDNVTREALSHALTDVARDPALAWIRAALFLEGFAELSLNAYDAIRVLERQAVAGGYPALC